MNWQMIDNIASTISSAVTVGGVVFGVLFGKKRSMNGCLSRTETSPMNQQLNLWKTLTDTCQIYKR